EQTDIRIVSLKEGSGKKAGVALGVREASGSIILCTDGDCRVPDSWVRIFASYFNEHNPKMISGPVKMYSNNWFGHYQALDFSSLIGFGASTLENGIASTCNGANMAYRKDVFEEVDGYEGNNQLPTGDDEFLLQKVHELYPDRVKFLKSTLALVTTNPKPTVFDFIQQRIRWGSKWRFHNSSLIKGTAVWAYLDALSVFMLIALTVTSSIPLLTAFLIIVARWLSEAYYLYKTSSFFTLNAGKRHYLIVSIIYPFYVFFLGFASIFGHYSWKGRKYH
ncbi:MAG: glycosyltransferase family 2 protein, partial [Bacteroidota bacterium]